MSAEIRREMEGVHLGDERLNARAVQMLESFMSNPSVSINAACNGWSESQAAYRFFNNARTTPEKILQPHIDRTLERIAQEKVVLMVQDTTELDFSKHPAKDAGVLNLPNRFGFYNHTLLAVTPHKVPLGVCNAKLYDRTPESLGKADERQSDPIETKESFRWLEGYRLACEVAAKQPDTQIVSVGDCECDIYDIYVEAQNHATPAGFVIRARVDRSLPERDREQGEAGYKKVRQKVAESPLVEVRTLDLPATSKREARQATLEIRACSVKVKPPHARSRLPKVDLNVVLVEEVDGPRDGTDVSWLLYTSLPVTERAEVLTVIEYYRARWAIEVYFRTLKTGCQVEKIQLETRARQSKALMFYMIIAWRVMYSTLMAREHPDLPCSVLFEESEWKSVWQIVERTPPPKKPPPLSEFIPRLAQLGGYNRRRGDAPPGPQAIWIGLRRMDDFALAWCLFHPRD